MTWPTPALASWGCSPTVAQSSARQTPSGPGVGTGMVTPAAAGPTRAGARFPDSLARQLHCPAGRLGVGADTDDSPDPRRPSGGKGCSGIGVVLQMAVAVGPDRLRRRWRWWRFQKARRLGAEIGRDRRLGLAIDSLAPATTTPAAQPRPSRSSPCPACSLESSTFPSFPQLSTYASGTAPRPSRRAVLPGSRPSRGCHGPRPRRARRACPARPMRAQSSAAAPGITGETSTATIRSDLEGVPEHGVDLAVLAAASRARPLRARRSPPVTGATSPRAPHAGQNAPRRPGTPRRPRPRPRSAGRPAPPAAGRARSRRTCSPTTVATRASRLPRLFARSELYLATRPS